MYFDHCVNYVKFLLESNYNFIGTLQYKLFVFLSEEKESYSTSMEKKQITKNKQTNKTKTITKNNKTKEGLYFWVNA